MLNRENIVRNQRINFTGNWFNSMTIKCMCVVVLMLGMQITSPRSAMAQFAGGDGSETAPYEIATPEQLALMYNYSDGYTSFILVKDLDLRRFDAGDGGGWLPIGDETTHPFNGKFNGNGKIIKNLTINRPDMSQVGLFGYLRQDAVVANVMLENVSIVGGEDVGSIAGLLAQSCIVANCHATSGTVTGGVSVGGLVGYIRTGSLVKNSSANVVVRSLSDYTGGLVGEMYAGAVENSTSKGTIYSATSNTGGLVGFMSAASYVRNSYSSSRVVDVPDTIRFRDNRYTGGLIGQVFDNSTLENSYASGNVSGNESVGGLVGWADMHANNRNNVALNTLVVGNGDVYATQGRIERSELEQQYTRSDMVIRENGITMSNTSSLENGFNIEFREAQIPFYRNIGWEFGVDEQHPWAFDEKANMPILWFEGAPVQSLSLNTNMITLYPEEVYELLATTIEPSNARLKLVIWTSTNPDVAAVSMEGVITAVSLGITTVVARTVDGGYETVCRVNVIPRPIAVAEEENQVSVSVFPNPVSDVLNVEASEDIVSVTVYSSAGTLLLERKGIDASYTSIGVSHLPKGVNVVVIRSKTGVRNLKFIVF